jgi:hypothetical protein
MKIKHRARPPSSRGSPFPPVTCPEDPERVRLTPAGGYPGFRALMTSRGGLRR